MIKEKIAELFGKEYKKYDLYEDAITDDFMLELLLRVIDRDFVEVTVLEGTPLEITVLREKDENEKRN